MTTARREFEFWKQAHAAGMTASDPMWSAFWAGWQAALAVRPDLEVADMLRCSFFLGGVQCDEAEDHDGPHMLGGHRHESVAAQPAPTEGDGVSEDVLDATHDYAMTIGYLIDKSDLRLILNAARKPRP